MKTRIERDSMGELEVPEAALYGAQTQRAINNFPVSGKTMPEAFIRALLISKSAAAQANANLELLPSIVANAISEVVEELLESPHLMNNFPVDVYQTGSGTSSNMNANEVLATLASAKVGEAVSANDHINYGQSSNDIIPSCIHISTAVEVTEQLLPALEHLHDAIVSKAKSVDHHIKTGRTHLMDAMPVRLSQSLLSWATQIEQNIYFIKATLPKLQTLAQGGTAVGTGINAHPGFAVEFSKQLSAVTGIEFSPADNLFTHINT
jgi:fumarate hydratase class II